MLSCLFVSDETSNTVPHCYTVDHLNATTYLLTYSVVFYTVHNRGCVHFTMKVVQTVNKRMNSRQSDRQTDRRKTQSQALHTNRRGCCRRTVAGSRQ